MGNILPINLVTSCINISLVIAVCTIMTNRSCTLVCGPYIYIYIYIYIFICIYIYIYIYVCIYIYIYIYIYIESGQTY